MSDDPQWGEQEWNELFRQIGMSLLLTVGVIEWHGGSNPQWLLTYSHDWGGSTIHDMADRILNDYIRWTAGDEGAGDRLRECFAFIGAQPPWERLGETFDA